MLADSEIAQARKREAAHGPRITSARYGKTGGKLVVEFDHGWELRVPVADIDDFDNLGRDPRDVELAEIEIGGDGRYVFFPKLDIALYGPHLVKGLIGKEAWDALMVREFGARKSVAKAAASRENGKKGGRPRKAPTVPAHA
jgi:hypothetical protein